MGINKKMREAVWLKYDKHCAYCGKEIALNEMQVDHMVPKARRSYLAEKDSNGEWTFPDLDKFENLMPTCRRCNHYKRASTLEYYREMIKTIHERIKKDYLVKVALDYAIIEFHDWNNQFYFERVEKNLVIASSPTCDGSCLLQTRLGGKRYFP